MPLLVFAFISLMKIEMVNSFTLTHLSQMNFPISISRKSLFQILGGGLGGIFIFIKL